ncbi:MAG TPA: SDR family NAD(P)-dependent oxidoreductase, partial [Jatrophihabitantaceae bacterium]|nr:SDR family NAD(P)-dependent oxidoreductase [Jatrophihabitantaceae bacterium]
VTKATPADEIRMLDVDVVAVADLCSRFVPGMVQRKRGAVLNVASTAAFQPLPGQAGYAAAKAFVLSYTQSLAGELRGTGVTATVLCPGPVDTNFADTAGFTPEEAATTLPNFMWESAAVVARCGIDGLARGRMVAIPGLANRIAARFAWLSPRSVLVPLLASRHPGLR